MTLYEKIVSIYPELKEQPNLFFMGVILLRDDSDGNGAYIDAWDYEKPRPTDEELAAVSGQQVKQQPLS